MKSVALGLVGCGTIGKVHLKYAVESPLINVLAVADVRQEAARLVATSFGIPRIYTDAEELFADPTIEAVVLALPTASRTKLALSAFAHGKHVLTEKPVAMSADEVRQMIKARGNLVAGCCSSRYRFTQTANIATKFLASRALGKIRTVHCRVIGAAGPLPQHSPPPWRLSKKLNGGGILVNWGCYDLDFLLGIMSWCLIPKLVLAQTWRLASHLGDRAAAGSDAETHFIAIIRCDGNSAITLERGEFVTAQSEAAWQIIGTKGSLCLQMSGIENNTLTHDDTTTERGIISKIIWRGNENIQDIGGGPIHDFAAAILEDRQPKTNLEQSLIIQKITDAIYTSAERGMTVEID